MNDGCVMMPVMSTKQTTTTGQHGENLALEYLGRQGYTLLARNWRCRFGELDLIVQRAGCIHVVEVKTRRSLSTDDARHMLTPLKLQRLVTATYHYMDAHALPADGWQLDLVTVTLRPGLPPHIEHLENCLDW